METSLIPLRFTLKSTVRDPFRTTLEMLNGILEEGSALKSSRAMWTSSSPPILKLSPFLLMVTVCSALQNREFMSIGTRTSH